MTTNVWCFKIGLAAPPRVNGEVPLEDDDNDGEEGLDPNKFTKEVKFKRDPNSLNAKAPSFHVSKYNPDGRAPIHSDDALIANYYCHPFSPFHSPAPYLPTHLSELDARALFSSVSIGGKKDLEVWVPGMDPKMRVTSGGGWRGKGLAKTDQKLSREKMLEGLRDGTVLLARLNPGTTNMFGEPESGEVMFFITSCSAELAELCRWMEVQMRRELHESVWKKTGRAGVQTKSRSLSLGIIRPYNAKAIWTVHSRRCWKSVSHAFYQHDQFRRLITIVCDIVRFWLPALFDNLMCTQLPDFPPPPFGCFSTFWLNHPHDSGGFLSDPHIDKFNCSWSMCIILALGNFDDEIRYWLCLSDYNVLLQFPAGSMVAIPSALLVHSNLHLSDLRVVATSNGLPPLDSPGKPEYRASAVFFTQATVAMQAFPQMWGRGAFVSERFKQAWAKAKGAQTRTANV